MASDPAQERKLLEEEAKLTAAWVNGVSIAFLVVGVLQPLLAQTSTRWSFVLLLAAIMVHLVARFLLRRQYPLE